MTRILDAGVPSTLTYDQAGNPLKQRNTGQPFNITMTWDAESRMTGYHQSGVSGGNAFNQQLAHVYNGDGLRVERTGGPGQAKYVWDGQNVHLKLSGANAILDSYRFEPATYGKLISTSSGWHLYDPLGSSTLITTSGGGIQGTYRFGAWGEIASASTSGTVVDPFLFVGREGYYSDNEGLTDKNTTSPHFPYYVRARFYNPGWGRWLNQDPIGFDSGDYNLFRYVENNPFNETDPSGLITIVPSGQQRLGCEVQCASKGEVLYNMTLSFTILGFQIWKCNCRPRPKTCGKCTPQELSYLQAAKDVACAGAGKATSPNQSCAKLAILFVANTACATARSVIQTTCFPGQTDAVHEALIKKHNDWAALALQYYGAHQPPCAPINTGPPGNLG